MASSFALACDALCRERDRVFLQRVSTDYNIPFDELEAKYLTEAEAAIKMPKTKAPRKAKVTVDGAETNKCQAMTAKKVQCTFSALKGECFCKRHLKQQGEDKQEVPKPVKPVPKKAAAKVEPVHTHPVAEPADGPCELCETHGDAMDVDAEGEWEEAAESEGAASESDFDEE